MKKFTDEEANFIMSLNKPMQDIDKNLVNSIINKMLQNSEYEKLINLLNKLYDFAEIPNNIVNKLIQDNNKECISVFLENEENLYFLNDDEKNRLKNFLNAFVVNIKLKESYEYYNNLLFNQGVRSWKVLKINDDMVEHLFIKYNKLIKIKLIEINNIGVIVSCVIYSNYNLSDEEQILKCIDYINTFDFNINRDINTIFKDL